jgi:hypothetical protein
VWRPTSLQRIYLPHDIAGENYVFAFLLRGLSLRDHQKKGWRHGYEQVRQQRHEFELSSGGKFVPPPVNALSMRDEIMNSC